MWPSCVTTLCSIMSVHCCAYEHRFCIVTYLHFFYSRLHIHAYITHNYIELREGLCQKLWPGWCHRIIEYGLFESSGKTDIHTYLHDVTEHLKVDTRWTLTLCSYVRLITQWHMPTHTTLWFPSLLVKTDSTVCHGATWFHVMHASMRIFL